MDKLLFLTSWDKDKTKTWSGTVWGLYVALSKIFNIHTIDIPKPRLSVKSRLKMLPKLFKGKNYWDAGIDYLNKKKQFVDTHINKDNSSRVFEFEEYVDTHRGNKTYLYQDMSIDAVKSLYYNNKEAFQMSNYSNCDIDCIEKRAISQNEYYKEATAIFVMGKWLSKYLVETLKLNNVYPVGGGINIDPSKIDHSRKTGNKILFIGRDFERKGGMLTVEAFKVAKQARPDIELHIAGPMENPVNECISGCYYHGDCEKDDIIDLYNKCDIFCMPSYFEAYGLVFIEALSFGLPCIGRNCFEMPYFIEHGNTGFLLDSSDTLIYSSYMLDLLSNKEIRQNVLDNKDYYLKEYTWDNVAVKIKKIIDKEK